MNLLLPVILAALAAFAPYTASATAQEPDVIIIDGERMDLNTNPLGVLLEGDSIKLPKPDERWSSNWRGYVATWKIQDEQLLLTRIDVLINGPDVSGEDARATPTNVLTSLFPEKSEVPANWYSGALIVPKGEVVNYVHMGYGSVYERYIVLIVKTGVVVERKDLDATQFEAYRREKFARYQKTPEYTAKLKEAQSDLSAESAESFLFEFESEEYLSQEL